MIDFKRLTIGEIAKIEELSGANFGTWGEDMPVTALAAMAFVWHRRNDKSLTWKTVKDEWTLDQIQEVLGLGEDTVEDPKESK